MFEKYGALATYGCDVINEKTLKTALQNRKRICLCFHLKQLSILCVLKQSNFKHFFELFIFNILGFFSSMTRYLLLAFE